MSVATSVLPAALKAGRRVCARMRIAENAAENPAMHLHDAVHGSIFTCAQVVGCLCRWLKL